MGEAIFCVIYLIFGFCSSIIMFINAEGRNYITLYAILTLVLADGDSFHLIPRIIKAFKKNFKTYDSKDHCIYVYDRHRVINDIA